MVVVGVKSPTEEYVWFPETLYPPLPLLATVAVVIVPSFQSIDAV
jgi:hypothetical protein